MQKNKKPKSVFNKKVFYTFRRFYHFEIKFKNFNESELFLLLILLKGHFTIKMHFFPFSPKKT